MGAVSGIDGEKMLRAERLRGTACVRSCGCAAERRTPPRSRERDRRSRGTAHHRSRRVRLWRVEPRARRLSGGARGGRQAVPPRSGGRAEPRRAVRERRRWRGRERSRRCVVRWSQRRPAELGARDDDHECHRPDGGGRHGDASLAERETDRRESKRRPRPRAATTGLAVVEASAGQQTDRESRRRTPSRPQRRRPRAAGAGAHTGVPGHAMTASVNVATTRRRRAAAARGTGHWPKQQRRMGHRAPGAVRNWTGGDDG